MRWRGWKQPGGSSVLSRHRGNRNAADSATAARWIAALAPRRRRRITHDAGARPRARPSSRQISRRRAGSSAGAALRARLVRHAGGWLSPTVLWSGTAAGIEPDSSKYGYGRVAKPDERDSVMLRLLSVRWAIPRISRLAPNLVIERNDKFNPQILTLSGRATREGSRMDAQKLAIDAVVSPSRMRPSAGVRFHHEALSLRDSGIQAH